MKVSFYIVLWTLALLLVFALDIPFLKEYGLIFACVIVLSAFFIVNKLLKTQLEYQNKREELLLFGMAYNNDFERYKRHALLEMAENIVYFVYMLSLLISLVISFSGVPLIDYFIISTFMILSANSSSWHIVKYLQVKKAGCVMLDTELKERYLSYKREREEHTHEEILEQSPKHYKIVNAANTLFSIFCLVIGLLLIAYSIEYYTNAILLINLFGGLMASYCGIKDLLNISNSQKYLLLLLSCIIAVLLYIPTTNYLNKYYLSACIHDDYSDLFYDAKSNIVHESIKVDDLTGVIPGYLRKCNELVLSYEGYKELLDNIIRVNAEYQIVYKDSKGNEQVITISPNELRDIHRQTRSFLDIKLDRIKLAMGENSTKIYDDGEYVIIEVVREDESFPVSKQEESLYAEFAKYVAERFDIASLNRGLKMRFLFNNHHLFESSFSLEELKNAEENTELRDSTETFNDLFNMF